MKKNFRKKIEGTKGITLVALVVTIIVLLILAGVALSSVLSQDGIFSRAKYGVGKYGKEKSRETLELALTDIKMMKYEENLDEETYNQKLDEQLNKIGQVDGENKDEVTVDGHIWRIDRSVPKILDYIGLADGIEIRYTISGAGYDSWSLTPNIKVSVTVKNNKGALDISSIKITRKVGNGIETDITSSATINSDGTFTLTTTEIAETIFTISVKNSEGEQSTPRAIKVAPKIDITGPIFTTASATPYGLDIKIRANATDDKSGLDTITYKIDKAAKDSEGNILEANKEYPLTAGIEETITTTAEGEYAITLTARDRAGNPTTKTITGVKTADGGVPKHIKLSDGSLKEVNTLDIYGADVIGYDCTKKKENGDELEWQLFYIDETKDEEGNVTDSQVYLISKDFIIPPASGDKAMTHGDYSHSYYWNEDVLARHTGLIPNNSFTQKFLSDYKGVTASRTNLQATNYMLDQTVWKEYMSTNNKADYAFGGPTLPLFQASYNDTCKVYSRLGIQKGETSDNSGYQINRGGGDWGNLIKDCGNRSTQKGIYFKGDTWDPAGGTWLASPALLYRRFCDGSGLPRLDSFGAGEC